MQHGGMTHEPLNLLNSGPMRPDSRLFMTKKERRLRMSEMPGGMSPVRELLFRKLGGRSSHRCREDGTDSM